MVLFIQWYMYQYNGLYRYILHTSILRYLHIPQYFHISQYFCLWLSSQIAMIYAFLLWMCCHSKQHSYENWTCSKTWFWRIYAHHEFRFTAKWFSLNQSNLSFDIKNQNCSNPASTSCAISMFYFTSKSILMAGNSNRNWLTIKCK